MARHQRLRLRAVFTPVALALAACSSGGGAPAPEPPQPPPAPQRTAAEAHDLRLMMAELAAARACKRLEGTFRPLTGSGEGGPVAGALWIEDCRDTETDTRVRLELSGRGWLWLARHKEKAGADFSLSQYARFRVSVTLQGTIDAAYAAREHIATVWFTPSGPPEVTFEPIGQLEVDSEGLWSSVVSGLASAFGRSPEQRARGKLATRGEQRFQGRFAEGIAATVDLCSGRVETGLGHPPQGQMLEAGTSDMPVEAVLHPQGLLLSGPHEPSGGPLTFAIDVAEGGRVRAQLVCQDQAAALADAFLAGKKLPEVEALAAEVVAGRAELQTRGRGCPVVLATRPAASAPVRFRIRRPSATSSREPLATCAPGPAEEPEPGRDSRGGPQQPAPATGGR